jgi:hypothetical protein
LADSTKNYLDEEGVKHVFQKIKILTDTFIYEQAIAANVWEIQHNMKKYPSVTIIDSANNEVMGTVEYIDNNNLRITFNGAFGGKAYLN